MSAFAPLVTAAATRGFLTTDRSRTGKPNPLLLTITANDAEALCDRIDALCADCGHDESCTIHALARFARDVLRKSSE